MAALVLLLSLPITVLYPMLFSNSAAIVVHVVVAVAAPTLVDAKLDQLRNCLVTAAKPQEDFGCLFAQLISSTKGDIVNSIFSFIKRHPLFSFFVVAYLFAWLGWTVPDRLYNGTPLTGVLTLPFILMVPGPLLGAIIVTAITDGKAGVITLLRKFTIWRVGWVWWAFALLVGPVVGLTAAYLNVWFGAPDPTAILISSLPGTLLLFATRLVNPVDGPMQEEMGWRGYALPRFQGRYAPLLANLSLGVMVAGWHLPWVWMGQLPLFALLGTVAYTFVAGWIYNNTKGSVLLVLVAHAADGLIRVGFTGADLNRFFVFYVAAWWLVALIVIFLHGPSLVRKPAEHAEVAPMDKPLAAR